MFSYRRLNEGFPMRFGVFILLTVGFAPDEQLQVHETKVKREVQAWVPASAPAPKVRPMIFKDETSGRLFYFENDGQHVAAIDKDGKILWHKNPVEEGKLPKYGQRLTRTGRSCRVASCGH
jgi:hypothetical protein